MFLDLFPVLGSGVGQLVDPLGGFSVELPETA